MTQLNRNLIDRRHVLSALEQDHKRRVKELLSWRPADIVTGKCHWTAIYPIGDPSMFVYESHCGHVTDPMPETVKMLEWVVCPWCGCDIVEVD